MLHPDLIHLRNQLDARWPTRAKPDGTIGDLAHKARKSDHNPNHRGVVCAIDITHDPENGCDAGKLAESLRLSRDPRIKYVIWNSRIFSSLVKPWEWREYAGAPHKEHVHISVNDVTPWTIE
jgi:hypothetical protein